MHITITQELDTSQRFDKALAMAVADKNISRAQIQKAIKSGLVKDAAGKSVKDWPAALPLMVTIEHPLPSGVKPEAMDLDIVFEDEFIMVINKPPGLVVHPGAGNWTGTLVHGLVAHLGDDVLDVGEDTRPGLVHRLDKDTSGLMVIAKTEEARLFLSKQLADRSMGRVYEALVWGAPPLPKMSFDGPIGRHGKDRLKMAVTGKGREAVTHIERKAVLHGGLLSLLDCHLETGRTHQIRVHLSHAGFPLVGDQMYGLQTTAARARCKKTEINPLVADTLLNFPRQALHAKELHLIHPNTREELRFTAPPPADLSTLLKRVL